MKRLFTLLVLLLPALALARDWQVAREGSTLGFSGSYQGDPFRGRFKNFEAKIAFDPADLATASFDVTVDLASVDTQSAERDQTLTGSDFFDTAKTPRAHFVSTRFSENADGSFTAHGTLDLHGIDKPVTLHVDFVPLGDKATLAVKATLARADWNLGGSDDWADISPDIEVTAHLDLSRE